MRARGRAFELAGTPGFEPGTRILEIPMIAISPRPPFLIFSPLYVQYAFGTTYRIFSILISSQPFLLICE